MGTLLNLIRQHVRAAFLAIFGARQTPVAQEPLHLPPTSPQEAPPNIEDQRLEAADHDGHHSAVHEGGQFYFKRQILDQLDQYFLYLGRMKRADREAYDLYSQIGACIVPSETLFQNDRITPLWRAGARPGFGAIAIAPSAHLLDEKAVYPQFGYFLKLKAPPLAAEPSEGDCYNVTLYYDDRIHLKKFGHGHPVQFYITVRPDGSVAPLRMRSRHAQHTWSKKHRGYIRIPSPALLKFPSALVAASRDNGMAPDDFARFAFNIIASGHESANSGVARVKCAKGATVAAFSLDIKRTAYFFRDRDLIINEHGRKRRIFHIVRPHARVRKNGNTSNIKMHFRGAREFDWNGYQINITVPGLHHLSLQSDFDIAAADTESAAPASFMEWHEAGKTIAGHLQGPH